MSEAGPPPKSYEQPRRYEIPERFRPAPRASEATVPGPAADRASAPTEPVGRPMDPPQQPIHPPVGQAPGRPGPRAPGPPPQGPGAGGPRRPGAPPGPGGPGRPAGPPPPGGAPSQGRPDTKIILLAIAVLVVVVGAALGAYLALSGGDSSPNRAGGPGGASDAATTQQIADKLYIALNAHDEAALRSLSCNPRTFVLGSIAGTLASVRQAHETSRQKLTVRDATSNGMMLVANSADPAGRASAVTFQLHLHKDGSRWCTAGLTPSTYSPATSPAPPTEPPGTLPCHSVLNVPVVAHLIVMPAPTGEAPQSFVPPTIGKRVATCVSHFRGNGHVARVVVWGGALMQQYVNQLKQLQWQVIGSLPATPVLQNGVGVRVTVVSDRAQLVILVDDGH